MHVLPPSFSTRLRLRRMTPRERGSMRENPTLGSVLDDIKEEISGGSEPTTKPLSPGAVPVRPGSWDLTVSPAEYVIEQGDTMFGLAVTYLGNGNRWGEIRDMQTRPAGSSGPNGPYTNRYTTKWFPGSTNPGRAYAPGDVLLMPQAAVDRLQAYIAAGQVSQAPPGQQNAPGNFPGANPGQPKAPSSTTEAAAAGAKTYGPLIAVGVVGAGLLAWKFLR